MNKEKNRNKITRGYKRKIILNLSFTISIKYKLYYTERSILSIIWIKYLFEFHKCCKRFSHHNRLNIYYLNYLHIWSCSQKLKVDCGGLGRCHDQCISIYSSTENRKRESFLYRSNLIETKKLYHISTFTANLCIFLWWHISWHISTELMVIVISTTSGSDSMESG